MNEERIIALAESIKTPETGVEFESENQSISRLFHKAEQLAANNVRRFPPGFDVLIESAGYSRLYTETQPMGGEMYAKRDPRVALNNQLYFMLCQRDDGRLSGGIFPDPQDEAWCQNPVLRWVSDTWSNFGLLADFGHLQGNALPTPAFNTYYLSGRSEEYLRLLAECLEAFDNYLWRTRDPYQEGVLQSWCVWDTGEDNCNRFGGSPNCWPHDYPPDREHTPSPDSSYDRERYYLLSHLPPTLGKDSVLLPFRSMDMMAYSYANRETLARISDILKDGKSDYWQTQATKVRDSLKESLWIPERGAAYDRNRDNKPMDVLTHNNLRCMWYNVFDQKMADEFIERHLLNPDEFFTPFPLPSIAANDPMFQNIANNNWSGPPQGLTWQRLIKALENYGRYSDLTIFGRIFIKMIEKTGVFVQQYDPFDTENPIAECELKRDGYGPTLLAFLEYISRFFGIHIERDIVHWSGLTDSGKTRYTQRFGNRTFELKNDQQTCSAFVNKKEVFNCSAGVRICTDLDGKPLRIIGIDTNKHHIKFNTSDKQLDFDVAPNQVIQLS